MLEREVWERWQGRERAGRVMWKGSLLVGRARTGVPGIRVVRGALEEEERLLWALNSFPVPVCEPFLRLLPASSVLQKSLPVTAL